jgi:peroxiredoxin
MLLEGNPAPDFTLPDVEDRPVVLSDILRRGQNVLLIFLRHLG